MEVDLAGVDDRSEDLEMFAKPFDGVRPRRAEGLPLGAVRSEAESEAEASVRRGLGRLCQRCDDQGMARIDRHDERSHAQAGHGRADQSGQGDGVVVELLGQPDLADTGGERAASLIDDVVDGVNRRRAPIKNYSGGHVRDNPPGRRRYSWPASRGGVRRAKDYGVNGIYCSNHGRRQANRGLGNLFDLAGVALRVASRTSPLVAAYAYGNARPTVSA